MNVIPRAMKRKRVSKSYPKMQISRPLRYNGEMKITRVCSGALIANNLGFSVGGTNSSSITIYFDPGNVQISGAASSATIAIPGASELSALYDLSRLDKVEMTWNASIVAQGANNTAPPGCPKFLVAFDPNDGAASSLDQIRQQNPKEYYSVDGRTFKFTCRPKFQRVVYQTSVVSNYEASTGFVNADSTIPHYAIKMTIPNASNLAATTACNVEFSWKMFYTLKNVK